VVVCNNRGLNSRVVLSLFRLLLVLLFRLPVGRYVIGLLEKKKVSSVLFGLTRHCLFAIVCSRLGLCRVCYWSSIRCMDSL